LRETSKPAGVRRDLPWTIDKKIKSIHSALHKYLRCYANSAIVGGIWYTYIVPQMIGPSSSACIKGFSMSKTASITLARPSTLFGRLMVSIDRMLMSSARIAVRNGDLPHFGL
jgi:hypothetical protein